MNDSGHQGTAAPRIVFDETLDISLIHDFYNQLKDAAQASTVVEIDVGKVAHIDTAALQLLYSWYTSAVEKGITINWKNTDGYFYQSARLLGLHTALGIHSY